MFPWRSRTIAGAVPDRGRGRGPAASLDDDGVPVDQGRASCAPSGSASRTGCARTTSTPSWPPVHASRVGARPDRPRYRRPSMARRYDTITFLSDYGLADEFVGVVKSVIRSIAPDVVVIDLTHEIAPHDVRGGGLTLARSAQYLAPGVVLAVVDPGVGSDRRAIAVEVGDGQSVLVGPDNGLLAAAVAMVGGADRVVELTNREYQLARARTDLRRPRRVRARPPRTCATASTSTELGDGIDPGDPAARAAAGHTRRGRRARRRGAVGRPVRQRAAQRRPRRGRRVRRSRPTAVRRDASAPRCERQLRGVAHRRGRPGRRLLRAAVDRRRPRLGRRPSSACTQAIR